MGSLGAESTLFGAIGVPCDSLSSLQHMQAYAPIQVVLHVVFSKSLEFSGENSLDFVVATAWDMV